MNAPAAADTLRIGGLQPFTTIDYPGALAAVVFVQGCPWRCSYCHNPHLQPRQAPQEVRAQTWAEMRRWLQRRARVLDALVFSGGEPTLDPALPAALREARALGYRIGLHSAGMSPRRLRRLLPLVDWVGLDVKAPLDDEALHDRISGVHGAAGAVRASLQALLDSGVAHECRTTVHPRLLAEGVLSRLGAQLRALGVRRWALQACRDPDGPPGADHAISWPDASTLGELRRGFPELALRPAV